MKYIVFLLALLLDFGVSAQSKAVFRVKSKEGYPLREIRVSRNDIFIQKTDSNGYISIAALETGDVLTFGPSGDFSRETFLVGKSQPDTTIILLAPLPPEKIVDVPAEFPGGKAAMFKFLAENMQYPAGLDIQGKCWLRFVVDEEGNISDIKVTRGIPDCPECDAESIRVVKLMPKFNPGLAGGKPVRVYYDLPINFRIQ